MRSLTRHFQIGLLLSAATLSAQAGSFFTDFNTGALPAGTHTNANSTGGAFLELDGGISNSGCLKLTKNINSQNGSFILDDLDAGRPIYGFDVTFKVRIGGGSGTPADGMSLSVGSNLSDTSLFGEGGTGDGLRFDWDIYNNPDTPPSPQINVRAGSGGTEVAWKGYTIAGITTSGSDPSTWWTDAHIRVNTDGTLNFDYKGANVFTNMPIPGYQAFVDSGLPMRFGLGARTGGLNANQWIDNLQITTFTNPALSIFPKSQVAQLGDTVDFGVGVGYTNGATFQWYRGTSAIAGATGMVLTLTNVQSSASNSQYTVVATGPSITVTSSVATLGVKDLAPPATPQIAYNFNDGAIPAAVTLSGTAIVDTTGGVTNSGCVKLTNPTGPGAMLVNDGQAGATLYGFTARFKMLVGGGTVPPADGFAFACGSDIPDAPSGAFQDGAGLGSGLVVSFDVYNNGTIIGYDDENPPAPSIDVRIGGQVVASVQMPISFMETGVNDDGTPAYRDTIIQMNSDGTLSVVYHGAVVFDHLPVPAFSSFGTATNASGSRFAIAAATGGLTENFWLDNFELTTVTNSGALRITTQPTSQTVLVNHGFTNNVAVNDATGATYQWYRNGTNLLAGATSSSYALPSVALTDSNATFSVRVTKSSVTVTSTPALLTVVNLTAPVSPNLTFNFDNGLVPTNTTLYSGAGGGTITPNGGVGDSGVLHITDSVNGESGAFVISNLFNGAQVSAIAASWDVRLGGGSGNPADGYSFNFANNLTPAVAGGETGVGNGLSVCWDIYGAPTDASPAPAINIKYQGNIIATTLFSKSGGAAGMNDIETGTGFRTVLLRVDADGKLYMSWGDRVLWNGLQLPNWAFIANGQYGFYGRTGGENENQWIDNIQIQATKSSGPLAVTTQPTDAVLLVGQTATFTVGLSDPNGATYVWQKNGTNISGATASTYTTAAATLADNGNKYRVVATSPNGTVTSSNALLTVVVPITISNPIVSFDFNDGNVPDDTSIYGVAYVSPTGGVGDSGCLHLTDNINGQGGAFVIPDPNSNAPVKAITAYFAIRVADGSGRPADGFSFVWAPTNDIGTAPNFGPNPSGVSAHGFAVGFDTYNNSGEAPSFNVYYHGAQLVNKLVPFDWLYTGTYGPDPTNQWADVFIRVNANGTMDLQYHTNAIFANLPLPGYSALAGGEFAIGAQTGGENETHWIDNVKITTTPGLAPVTIGFSASGGNLKLTWSGNGFQLQASPSVIPTTWTNVPGATSPYTAPLTGRALFFRLAPAP